MQWLGLKGKFKTKNIVLIKMKSDVLRIICYNAILQLHNLIKNGQSTLLMFKCAEGKRYLSPIKDLFNNEIIAYDLAQSPNFE